MDNLQERVFAGPEDRTCDRLKSYAEVHPTELHVPGPSLLLSFDYCGLLYLPEMIKNDNKTLVYILSNNKKFTC